jgi:hypothetical protein
MKTLLFLTVALCVCLVQAKWYKQEQSNSDESNEDSDLPSPPRITKSNDNNRKWWGSENTAQGAWWGTSDNQKQAWWGTENSQSWWGAENSRTWWGGEKTKTWWSVPSRDDYDICRVSNNKVETITNIRYNFPTTTCYTILVKECASEPKFLVLLRRLRLNTDDYELKITTSSNTIVLRKTTTVQVYLNGKHYNTDDILEITEFGRLVSLIVKDKTFTTVTLPTYGVQLAFDGYNVVLRVAKSAGNQLCGGVCDHRVNENVDPLAAGFVESDINEQIHKNYVLKDQCVAE